MSKTVKLGNLAIGGKNPPRIKVMLKTPTSNRQGLLAEAKALQKEGAEALRMAVKEEGDVKVASFLKKNLKVPLVADIHFHPRLALLSIDGGLDGIRLNPLNISKKKDVVEIARAAKKNKVAIRVGVNSGGFKRDFSSKKEFARAMVSSVGSYLKILEGVNFFDIMVSLKGADVATTVLANQLFASKFSYPIHLGITATGVFLDGVVKSSIGLGDLLSKGVGDIIRVSLTAPSFLEIRVAKYILQTLGLRIFGPQIVSCPTCSRCEVDLIKIVDRFQKELICSGLKKPLHIALMGCVVNGPGEAYQADIGAAFGKKKAAIFKKDKILSWTNDKKVVGDLLKEIKKQWK